MSTTFSSVEWDRINVKGASHMSQAKKVIALIGGIASGKSYVASCFSACGAAVIDADQVAREIVIPPSETLDSIVAHFGEHILTSERMLNRAALSTIVFSDPEERAWLEALMHPVIRKRIIEQTEHSDASFIVIELSTLSDPSHYPMCDRICLVDVPEQVQLKRLMQRDGLTKDQAQARVDAQISREARQMLADDVIDGNTLRKKIMHEVKQYYQALSN